MSASTLIPELQDFDNEDAYKECEDAVMQASALNFVVQFDSTKAYSAINLGVDAVRRLLQTEVSIRLRALDF